MNYIDIIIAIPLVWGLYQGFSKGLIISAASLAALILGIYGAIKFSHITSFYLINNFDLSDKYLPIIAFAVTFVIIVVLIHLLAKILDKLVKAVALGFINRIAGMVFNVFKFAFILSVIIMILEGFDKKMSFIPKDMKEQSLLYEPLASIAPMVFPYLNFEKIKEDTPITEFDI